MRSSSAGVDLLGAGANARRSPVDHSLLPRHRTNAFSDGAASYFASASLDVVDEQEGFEHLVTQYESASNRLPANLSTRFHDSIPAAAAQLSLLVEQWVATEGPGAGAGGGGGGGSSSTASAVARARRNSLIGGASPSAAPAAQTQQPLPQAANSSRSTGATRRRGQSVTMHSPESNSNSNNNSFARETSAAPGAAGGVDVETSVSGAGVDDDDDDERSSAPTSPNAAAAAAASGAAITVLRRSGGGSVGMSTAAKARLRHALEQGLTDYVNHLQSTVLAEIEVVNIASSQVVARGGQFAQQCKATIMDLAAAKREMQRIQDSVREQASRMAVLEGDSTKREEQFDFLRQQLLAREDMLRETTTTFRKELNRYKSRVADLEAELERRRAATGHSVVGGWGYRPSPSLSAPSPSQQHDSAGAAVSMAGVLRPQNLRGSANNAIGGNIQPQRSPRASTPSGGRTGNDPDPRGVLAAAAATDTLGSGSPDASRGGVFSEFSFSSPQATLVASDEGGGNMNNNNTLSDYHNNNNTISPTFGGSAGLSASTRRALSAVPSLGVSHLVQVASEAGVAEALREQQREFEKKLFAVKERMMTDKRQSVAELRATQETTIKMLRRDVEQLKLQLAQQQRNQ